MKVSILNPYPSFGKLRTRLALKSARGAETALEIFSILALETSFATLLMTGKILVTNKMTKAKTVSNDNADAAQSGR